MIYSSILLNNSLKESIMFITEGPLFILEDAIPHITENIIVGNTALFSIIVIKLLGNKFTIMFISTFVLTSIIVAILNPASSYKYDIILWQGELFLIKDVFLFLISLNYRWILL